MEKGKVTYKFLRLKKDAQVIRLLQDGVARHALEEAL